MGCTPSSSALRPADDVVVRPGSSEGDSEGEACCSSESGPCDDNDLSLVSEGDHASGELRLPTPALRESAPERPSNPLDIDGVPDQLLQSSASVISQEEDRNRPVLPGADWKSWAGCSSRQSVLASPEDLAAYESIALVPRGQSVAGYSTDEPLPLWWRPAFLALLTDAEKERIASELQREGVDSDERAVINCLTPRRAAIVQQWVTRISADDTRGTA